MENLATPFFDGPSTEGGRTIGLRGRIGAAEAGLLQQACLPLARAGKDVVFDCAQLEHLSGAALQVLLALQAQLAHAGAKLSLVAAGGAVAQTLTRAGVTGLSASA